MRKKLTNLLQLAKLKEEEIKIYLILLKLNEATTPQLTLETGLNSMMVYRTINRLLERNLIERRQLNNKQFAYLPLSLNSLIKKIEAKQKQLKKLADCLKNVDSFLPYIDITKIDEEPIEIREGIDAFKEEYLKMPNVCKEEFIHIGSMHNFWKTAGMSYESPEERNFIHSRMAKGIYARIINVATKEAEEFIKNDSLEKRTTKLRDNIPITDNYFAMSEKHSALFLCDSENPRVIIVKQPELLEVQKKYFSNLWKTSI